MFLSFLRKKIGSSKEKVKEEEQNIDEIKYMVYGNGLKS